MGPQRDDVDLVQQPEYDLFSCFGAVIIKGFKVSFVIEETREGNRVALLGESLERSRRLEAKVLLFNNGKKPGKSLVLFHSHGNVVCLRKRVGMCPGCVW